MQKHDKIVKGGQGRTEDDIIETAMATLVIVLFGGMILFGMYLIGFLG